MNEQKNPADHVWTDGNGDELWALAVRTVQPTRSAALVGASVHGVFLTSAQCREVAAHLTALADAHEHKETPMTATDRDPLDLARELLAIDASAIGGSVIVDSVDVLETVRAAQKVARAVVDLTDKLESGEASDGYHTHNELYEYRTLYHAHAVRDWLARGYHVTKSWNHADGEPCFGGGWFVVTAQLPTGQVTNHYPAKDWELFDVPEVKRPAEWDGYTPQEAAARIRAAVNGETND